MSKNSQTKDYALCLGNFSKDFTISFLKRTGLRGILKCFFVDFNLIDTNDILDINKYLVKKTWCKIMFGLIEKIFIGSLTGLVNGSYNHTTRYTIGNI